jgi:hypothetical protein
LGYQHDSPAGINSSILLLLTMTYMLGPKFIFQEPVGVVLTQALEVKSTSAISSWPAHQNQN